MSDIGQFALFFSIGLGALGFFFSPVGRAVGRWIEPRGQKGSDPERFTELATRLADLEANCERLAEIEERLDFAERLLAQQREPRELGQ